MGCVCAPLFYDFPEDRAHNCGTPFRTEEVQSRHCCPLYLSYLSLLLLLLLLPYPSIFDPSPLFLKPSYLLLQLFISPSLDCQQLHHNRLQTVVELCVCVFFNQHVHVRSEQRSRSGLSTEKEHNWVRTRQQKGVFSCFFFSASRQYYSSFSQPPPSYLCHASCYCARRSQ